MKFFSFKKIIFFFSSFSRKEKIIFFILFFILFSSSFLLLRFFYQLLTVPQASESEVLKEGFLGFPDFSNPLYSQWREPDGYLNELLFPSLFIYQNGKLMPSLVEHY
ncbi:MAG: hypothetical protein ACPLZH_00335, partial [Minisyncoccales bacterium]